MKQRLQCSRFFAAEQKRYLPSIEAQIEAKEKEKETAKF